MAKFLSRESAYPIEEYFLSRISSRAFRPEKITDEELLTLFEAARWAPSSYNGQPWRFVYVRKGDPEWNGFFHALVDFNKSWCKDADVLVVVLSRNLFEHNGKPSHTSRFDTGAAWMSLALQAHALGIVAHGMQGFDYEEMKKLLHIPEHFTVEAMIALGKQGDKDALPEDLRSKEEPSTRKPLEDIVSRGKFSFS